jgi:hypothetical protein
MKKRTEQNKNGSWDVLWLTATSRPRWRLGVPHLIKWIIPVARLAIPLDEPPRVFRRLGCLSQATIADSSSCR